MHFGNVTADDSHLPVAYSTNCLNITIIDLIRFIFDSDDTHRNYTRYVARLHHSRTHTRTHTQY